jgi:hypothetical protein
MSPVRSVTHVSGLDKDCVVVNAGRIEPVSRGQIPDKWESNGNFVENASDFVITTPFRAIQAIAYIRIPVPEELGIASEYLGIRRLNSRAQMRPSGQASGKA